MRSSAGEADVYKRQAFTTSRTANAARALGCSYVLIGHCEERKDKAGILAAGGGAPAAVNGILNQEIREAVRACLLYTSSHCGLNVLALSCITNLAAGILDQPLSAEEVIEVAGKAGKKFTGLLEKIVEII